MPEGLNMDQAREVIENGIAEAQEVLSDPTKINALLDQLKAQLADLPETVTDSLTNIPLMAQMVKSYVTKEYTNVSPKVVASLVAAFLYLVKKKDIIPDAVPVLGLVDDFAVITAAMAINKPELEAYQAWRDSQQA